MDFSQFQMIWNEENERSMFAIDREALRKLVDQEAKSIRFGLRSFEKTTIASFFILSLVVGSEPLFEGHDYYQYYEAAIFFVVSVIMFFRCRSRAACEADFGSSLVEEVNLAIWRQESLIARLKEYAWFAITPMLGMWFVRTFFQLAAKPLWLQVGWPIALISIPFFFHLAIKKKHLPRLNSLMDLRETLSSGTKS